VLEDGLTTTILGKDLYAAAAFNQGLRVDAYKGTLGAADKLAASDPALLWN